MQCTDKEMAQFRQALNKGNTVRWICYDENRDKVTYALRKMTKSIHYRYVLTISKEHGAWVVGIVKEDFSYIELLLNTAPTAPIIEG